MTITRTILFLFLFLSVLRSSGQAGEQVFLSAGKIEYEKKVNMYALMGRNNPASDEIKSMMPQFRTTYHDLLFTEHTTLFRPGKEDADNSQFGGFGASEKNVVYKDLEKDQSISQRDVMGESFLIQDSLRKIDWKITEETREIAGFTCRRANAVIMDSIYVVAFYTDEILPSGGPESFNGLPGMILGLALPHQHITWFATKVEAGGVTNAQLAPPQKGKKVDNAAFKQNLQKNMSSWGGFANQFIVSALL